MRLQIFLCQKNFYLYIGKDVIIKLPSETNDINEIIKPLEGGIVRLRTDRVLEKLQLTKKEKA